jgi:hypothetical protein
VLNSSDSTTPWTPNMMPTLPPWASASASIARTGRPLSTSTKNGKANAMA